MQTFTPDSSIASDVIPSANFGERNKGRVPDILKPFALELFETFRLLNEMGATAASH